MRIKPLAVVRELIRQTNALWLPRADKRHLLDLLDEARQSFRRRDVQGGLNKLGKYGEEIKAMRGNAIPVKKADAILAHLDLSSSCVIPGLQITDEELMEDQAASNE